MMMSGASGLTLGTAHLLKPPGMRLKSTHDSVGVVSSMYIVCDVSSIMGRVPELSTSAGR